MRFALLVLSLILLAAGAIRPDEAFAQVPSSIEVSDSIWEVRLTDGSQVVGRVVEVSGTRVVVVSTSGTRVEFERSQIAAMRPIGGRLRNGEVWPVDQNITRLFFAPTGRSMAAGNGYVAAYELFLPFVSYSFTDRFTLAGGTPLIPGAIGEVFYLAPKLGLYQTENTAISAGIITFFSGPSDVDIDSFGVAYGVGTWGGPDNSLTFGAGIPFVTGDLAQRPLFMAGGESRLSRRTKFITENYFLLVDNQNIVEDDTDFISLLSGGVRFIGDRLSADLGLGYGFSSDGEAGCCLPLVNFVYTFGEPGS